IVLYEVYKKIKRERGEETAILFSGRLHATRVVQLTESIAYLAADIRLRHGLAMADAIVYATAQDQNADVVTGDADLKDLPGVVQLSESFAYVAADSRLRHGLAMADAIGCATAQEQSADGVTGDADLKDLPGVVYVKWPSAPAGCSKSRLPRPQASQNRRRTP